MKKLLILLLVVILVLGFLVVREKSHQIEGKSKLKVGGCFFFVDLARTEEEKRQGLSGREKMGELKGMLFVYDFSSRQSFWMMGMNFPLDFVWIRDEKIVALTENVPSPKEMGKVEVVSPKEEVDQILEINGGLIEKCEIRIGQKVNLKSSMIRFIRQIG